MLPVIITKKMKTGNEKQNVNIAEILRYAPKGLKLYSPIFGEVKFKEIDDDNCVVVDDKYNNHRWFYEYGTFFPSDENNFSEGECLLFPSINHRCWNHWQNTLFLESIGSVCIDSMGYKYILENNGTFFSDGTGSGYSVIIENDESNYFLNSRYATPEETKEFFEELNNNGYKWDGEKVVKKGNIKPKFKVGDIVKFDRPSAMLKREILSIDFENERYLTRRTDIGGAIKEFIYFCEQDDYVIVGSHNNNLSLEVKVSMLADEIIALKQRVKALEIQVIKDMSTPPLTQVYSCPDKAGDCVTLKDMKS